MDGLDGYMAIKLFLIKRNLCAAILLHYSFAQSIDLPPMSLFEPNLALILIDCLMIDCSIGWLDRAFFVEVEGDLRSWGTFPWMLDSTRHRELDWPHLWSLPHWKSQQKYIQKFIGGGEKPMWNERK
jgi:hypothetical protein